MSYPDDQLSFDMQHAHVFGRKMQKFLEVTTCLKSFQTKKNSLLALFFSTKTNASKLVPRKRRSAPAPLNPYISPSILLGFELLFSTSLFLPPFNKN